MINQSSTSPARNGSRTIAELRGICKTYYKPDGSVLVEALKSIDLDIRGGQYLAIMGASGSGKSTLMNILGCLDQPTAGEYLLDGSDVATLDDDHLSQIRGRKIGFVFQAFNLVPSLSALENVAVPLLLTGTGRKEAFRRARELIETVGLTDRSGYRPGRLSGGQQQRVCIARALAVEPDVLLMDEPASALDPVATLKIEELIQTLKKDYTIVIVTHNMQQAARVSDITAFFYLGKLIEVDNTNSLFTRPKLQQTADYITGRFG